MSIDTAVICSEHSAPSSSKKASGWKCPGLRIPRRSFCSDGQRQGWYVDPFGHHEARWISDGSPTALVRVGRIESQDPRADAQYSGTLQALPDDSRSDGGDLRRADEAESSNPKSVVWSVVNVFDQTGWPISGRP
jgi:hypothetical protein